jgi:transcription elongation factor Elf1
MKKYAEAVRQLLESELCCPKCHAMNRPGALIVRFEQDGTATCNQCGANFPPTDEYGSAQLPSQGRG